MKVKAIKYSLPLALAFMSLHTFASIQPYYGIGFGRSVSSVKYDDPIVAANTEKHERLSGWLGNAYAGLDWRRSWFDMALEGWYQFSDTKGKQYVSVPGNNYTFMARHAFGVALLPGARVNHQGIYTRLGVQWSQLKYRTDISALEFAQFKKNQPGGIFGFGFDAPIAHGLSLRTEYDFSMYKAVDRSNGTNSIHTRLYRDRYWLGLTYRLRTKDNEEKITPIAQGFTVAIGGGRDVPTMRTKLYVGSLIITEDRGLSGGVGYVLVGYHHDVASWLGLGLESSASYSTAKYREIFFNTYKIRLKDVYDLHARVGFNLSSADQLYLLGGGAIGRWTKTGGTTTGANFSRYRTGWEAGVGDELAVSDRLSLRLDGEYIKFSNFASNNSNANNSEFKPIDERVMLGAEYHLF